MKYTRPFSSLIGPDTWFDGNLGNREMNVSLEGKCQRRKVGIMVQSLFESFYIYPISKYTKIVLYYITFTYLSY